MNNIIETNMVDGYFLIWLFGKRVFLPFNYYTVNMLNEIMEYEKWEMKLKNLLQIILLNVIQKERKRGIFG